MIAISEHFILFADFVSLKDICRENST